MSDLEPSNPPLLTVIGTNVALGPLVRELVPTYTRWLNDPAVARTLERYPRPITIEQRIARFEQASVDQTSAPFTIYERDAMRPIGLGTIHDIDQHHGAGELGIIIGEADARGRGLGTDATRLLLDYAFTAAGLHNVMLRVYAFNLAGIRAYQKAGFREIGRRHACQVLAGKRYDEVFMECLATDFESPVLAKILAPDEPHD